MGSQAQSNQELIVAWAPQVGPQVALVQCPCDDVNFGGARGGGKTYGMLGDFAIHADTYGRHAKGVFVRHTIKQLEETINQSHEIYSPLRAKWRDSDKLWTFPGGGTVKFRYVERMSDAENFMGHQYTRIYREELTNWADPKPLLRLNATLRSAAGVPCRVRSSCNPGGPGHHWVKAMYIDHSPQGYDVWQDEVSRMWRTYIPARVSDNHLLLESDPTYVDRLKSVGSPELVRAWLEGDWSVIEGAFFPEFDLRLHVIRPFVIPKGWLRFVAMDWGSARPSSVGWYAVSDGNPVTLPHGKGTTIFPRGALIRYREWYTKHATQANTGLRLSAEVLAKGILTRSDPDRVNGKLPYAYCVADPAIFAENGGPSIAEMMRAASGMVWKKADHQRHPGWDQVRGRLVGLDGSPMVYIFDSGKDLIRTLPALQHDENDPEDVDTDLEDHAPDEFRYACMSRPWTPPGRTTPAKPRGARTIEEWIEHVEGQDQHSTRRI